MRAAATTRNRFPHRLALLPPVSHFALPAIAPKEQPAGAVDAGLAPSKATVRESRTSSTLGELDQLRQIAEVVLSFRGNRPIWSSASRVPSGGLISGLTGRNACLVEIEGRSPASGAAGIENSGRLAEAVKRYLVTEHRIPIYRLYACAPVTGTQTSPPVKASSAYLRLMENSLAAQGAAPPQVGDSLSGTGRP